MAAAFVSRTVRLLPEDWQMVEDLRKRLGLDAWNHALIVVLAQWRAADAAKGKKR